MTTDIRYVVIGHGSIGQRHISNLKILFPGARIGCMSASGRNLASTDCEAHDVLSNIQSAVEAKPKFAIIASPANTHLRYALPFLRAGIPTLIEKPLCTSLTELESNLEGLKPYKHLIDIGYNLRYLPSAIKFKSLLQSTVGSQHHVRIEIGQYLPDWRPHSDYRFQVTAQKKLGGGALLELSHELDYLLWIFGEFSHVCAFSENTDILGIDVEESIDAMLRRDEGPTVSLRLDLLQRKPVRHCSVTGANGRLDWNLLENTITFTDSDGVMRYLFREKGADRNQMYMDELKRFEQVAERKLPPMVDLDHAYRVMRYIEAIRYSSIKRKIVEMKEQRC